MKSSTNRQEGGADMNIMKTIVPAFFVMIMCGCSQSHSVSRDDPNMWLYQARMDLLDENATVTTTDGLSLYGTVVALNEDSVVVRDGDSETAIDLRSVASIGTSGSIIAPVLGVIGGAVAGGAIGSAMAGYSTAIGGGSQAAF
jgi:hypothetical protein